MTQAMRRFAAWSSARPHRLILLAVLFMQLLAPVAGALVVLATLRHGPRAATLSAITAGAGFTALAIAFGAGAVEALGLTLPLWLGLASGLLLGWSRSLSLAFQGTVVGIALAMLAVFIGLIDPERVGAFVLDEAIQVLTSGGMEAAQVEQLAAIRPGDMAAVLASLLLASSLVSLLLGYWWFTLIGEGLAFGAEFRSLALGRTAALLMSALLVLGLVSDIPAVVAVAPLSLVGFLFQGLAVLHARRVSEGWHWGFIALVYLSLVSPLALWAYLGIGAIGLLDNFFPLRAAAAPRD